MKRLLQYRKEYLCIGHFIFLFIFIATDVSQWLTVPGKYDRKTGIGLQGVLYRSIRQTRVFQIDWQEKNLNAILFKGISDFIQIIISYLSSEQLRKGI